jgi:hypothetical protein
VQKHVLHIKLMNRPGAGDGQEEHGANRGRLDHRVVGLIVVDVGSLDEIAKDPTSLVPLQRAVRVELVLKNPLAGDNVEAKRARDNIPGNVGDKGRKLFFHGAHQFGSMRATRTKEATGDKLTSRWPTG